MEILFLIVETLHKTVKSLPKNSTLSSTEALKWALCSGNSTIGDIGRDIVLNLLQEFVKHNNGMMKIYSNDSYLNIKNAKIEYLQKTIDFSGTLVDIGLLTFGQKNQCDESSYSLTSVGIETKNCLF